MQILSREAAFKFGNTIKEPVCTSKTIPLSRSLFLGLIELEQSSSIDGHIET